MIATERLLLREDQPVVLGGRALDILIALTERAGDVVSRQELIDRVWRGVTVEKAIRQCCCLSSRARSYARSR